MYFEYYFCDQLVTLKIHEILIIVKFVFVRQNILQTDRKKQRGGLGPQRAPSDEAMKFKRKANFSEALRAQHRSNLKVRTAPNPDPKSCSQISLFS